MKLLGIGCYMGLVTYPKISDYWSQKKDLQKCSYSVNNGKEQISETAELNHYADNKTADQLDGL